jgi:HEPN domain-containing protein
MVRSQQERVQWSVKKAQEFYDSAIQNIEANRRYPAAEEVFRSVESCLTALLYNEGITRIEYKDWDRTLTGRLAHQSLVREYLFRQGIISNEEYQKYLNLVNDLHHEGYQPGTVFDKQDIIDHAEFAENLLIKVRATISET